MKLAVETTSSGDEFEAEHVRPRNMCGCHVELIMKDISTACYQPQRLWQWAEIASEVAEEFAR